MRESRTIRAMIGIYCRAFHGASDGLCDGCERLLEYANGRLERCPFGAEKPACAYCPVHCYKATMRQQIKNVMRYAGPRMLYRHPILAIHHIWNSCRRKKEPRDGS